MTIQSKLEAALPYLPQTVQQAVKRLPDPMQIQELRLRIGRPVQIVRQTGRTVLLLPNGQPVTADRQMIDTVFHNICAHSVHSWQDAIRQGFITIAGGSRVGLCGTAVMQQGILETVRAVSGMNIRIASERIGCADALFSRLGNRIAAGGLLIAGAPNPEKQRCC
ncbi:MAG: hypothetical protein IKQ91_08140, partial [Oscillospiraceae bacterium]|nr:hypothetical protein [Oscillospiraceae bacterium]